MLRPYQQDAIEKIRTYYLNGKKRVLLHAPVGSGKTHIFSTILKSIYEKKKNAILVVNAVKLVEQASERLDREGVDHGVIMGNNKRNKPDALIQVCSIQTLGRRKTRPPADMIVIDEAHYATSKSYRELADDYPDAYFLGVTATPYVIGSLRHIADVIVKPVTMRDLIRDGYLVGPIYYAPSTPDLTGVRTRNGEFATEDLDEILNQSQVVGDLVSSWEKLGENRPTLAFGVTVLHSMMIADAFNKAGIPARHVDATTKNKERYEAISGLESGKLKIISNVGILGVGVDIPSVSCIISARPTKSYALWVQLCGRGTRPFPGKKDFRVLDHSGNVLRHGCILAERNGSLDPIKKTTRPVELTTCSACYAVFAGNICPECGESNRSEPRKQVETIEGELVSTDPFYLQVVSRRGELKDIAKRNNYHRNWVYYQLEREFGKDVASTFEPIPWVRRSAPDFSK